jgi:hypothetical protein
MESDKRSTMNPLHASGVALPPTSSGLELAMSHQELAIAAQTRLLSASELADIRAWCEEHYPRRRALEGMLIGSLTSPIPLVAISSTSLLGGAVEVLLMMIPPLWAAMDVVTALPRSVPGYYDGCAALSWANGTAALSETGSTDSPLSPEECQVASGGEAFVRMGVVVGGATASGASMALLAFLATALGILGVLEARTMSMLARTFAARGIALKKNKHTVCGFPVPGYSPRALFPNMWALVAVFSLVYIVFRDGEVPLSREVQTEPRLQTACANETVFYPLTLSPATSADLRNITEVAFCFSEDNPTAPVLPPDILGIAYNFFSSVLSMLPWAVVALPYVFSVYGDVDAEGFATLPLHTDLGSTVHEVADEFGSRSHWRIASIASMIDGLHRTRQQISILRKQLEEKKIDLAKFQELQNLLSPAGNRWMRDRTATCDGFTADPVAVSRTWCTKVVQCMVDERLTTFQEDLSPLAVFFAVHASETLKSSPLEVCVTCDFCMHDIDPAPRVRDMPTE